MLYYMSMEWWHEKLCICSIQMKFFLNISILTWIRGLIVFKKMDFCKQTKIITIYKIQANQVCWWQESIDYVNGTDIKNAWCIWCSNWLDFRGKRENRKEGRRRKEIKTQLGLLSWVTMLFTKTHTIGDTSYIWIA